MKISAFIPVFNQGSYISKCLNSILAQGIVFDTILIIDDGSNSKKYLNYLGNLNLSNLRIVENQKNEGRGFCRNQAFELLSSNFILAVDASNILPPNYIKTALPHFSVKDVSAVSGLINNDKCQDGTVYNWRARHLFKQSHDFGNTPEFAKSLTTYATVFRRSSVMKVGNFDTTLKHSEDKDLGMRLLHAGYKIIGDPNLVVYSIKNDSVISVLERYWRWYGGEDESMSFYDYLNAIKASIKPMIQLDLKSNDWRTAFISFLCPHYGYIRFLYRKITGKLQKTY